MIYCPKCKSEIDSDSRFCDQCGQEVFFCSQCGKPGKGLRCTSCGGVMVKYDSLDSSVSASLATNRTHSISTTSRTISNSPTSRNTQQPRPQQLFMINDSLQMRLKGADGALLGRRMGEYKDALSHCYYISGTHARLNFNSTAGWSITDCGSSNGTSVNSKKITPNQPCILHNGDHVMLANVEFRIEIK